MKSLSDALSKNNITRRPITIVDVAGSFNLRKPFAISALLKILLKKVRKYGTTTKLYQLTGDWDREQIQRTMNSNAHSSADLGTWYRLTGTDLGSSFEHKGRIYFLFGDTHSTDSSQPDGGDSIAYTTDNNPEQGLHLTFVTSPTDHNNYLAPRIIGLPQHPGHYVPAGFEVPTSGFSVNNKMYVIYTVDHFKPDPNNDYTAMGKSVLVRSDDDAQSPFTYLYDLSVIYPLEHGKFINVSTVIVNNADIPHPLPDNADPSGKGLLLWGSGLYHKSNPCLAYLPLTGVEDRRNLRYFAGTEPGTDRPIWKNDEREAVELFNDQPQIGEICVNWNQFLGVWLMLYNAETPPPGGINFRVAKKPWGPWSPTALLFDPWIDQGYCHFIHVPDSVCMDHNLSSDSVCDPDHDRNDWGASYGAYIISRYTKGDNNRSTIYFVMSTWNPYNRVLMKSTFELEQS